MNFVHLIFPAGADYALLVCCLATVWAIADAIRAFPHFWPLVRSEFRELNAQRRHRRLLAKLKGK